MSLSAKSHVKTLLENKLRVHFVLFFFLSSFEKAFTGYTEEKPLAVYISPPTFRSLFLKISTQHSEHRDNCWVHTCCCAVGKPEGSLHTAWMPILACKNKAHFYWRLYLLFNFFPPSPFFFLFWKGTSQLFHYFMYFIHQECNKCLLPQCFQDERKLNVVWLETM